ncbi:hypothetical protein DENSPDRAFT_894534 [Dentipellis sp. KUC8613]|nr:hypothetical protein DENSPDRAFT_894534 [Dentipellis sp. KUC8613]
MDDDSCSQAKSEGYHDGLLIGYSVLQENIPGIAIEMALFADIGSEGINLTLSIATAIVLLRQTTGEGLVHKRLLMVLALMFILATADVVMHYLGSIQYYGGDVGNIGLLLCSSSRPLVLLLQAALGDSVTIWRCYNVFGKSIIVVVLPVLTALASFILGLYLAAHSVTAGIHVPLDTSAKVQTLTGLRDLTKHSQTSQGRQRS